MDDDWESLAEKDNIVIAPPKISSNINKWEGEDEDEDVKDSWEDEEEKKDEEKQEAQPTPSKTKPKKALQQKLNEKDRKQIEEEERYEKMTPEEKLAEKLRLQQIEKESDFKNALDTFGVHESFSGLDAMNPTNKAEFNEFAEALSTKISNYKSDEEYPAFIEVLVRSICAHLSAADLKKIKITIDSLHLEKQKMEKEKAKKPSTKGKTKIKLRVETDIKSNNANDYDGGYDDYDDFM
ncbi:eukaryotic translation initiation factor 3 subunit J [Condylostylus longicornis]|uniref:eukaryotic translation initiation factor 3 subunit J n=1 Tax=Condylostylus longicornis TaxID=2530218 RepID=UPI00244DBC4C|nr:eukaryotic translation initiation factor 3 subunit J [Condylostylus longicornis]